LLALLKHPLIGVRTRRGWPGSKRFAFSTLHFESAPSRRAKAGSMTISRLARKREAEGCLAAWQPHQEKLEPIDGPSPGPLSLADLAPLCRLPRRALAGDRRMAAARDGRMAAELLAELQGSEGASNCRCV